MISGPSGAGKGSLIKRISQVPDCPWISISATTRAPRKDEIEGKHYFFLSDERFDELLARDGFLEWASVHGYRYGTLREEIVRRIDAGQDVILEIDPQGAFQVKEKFPQAHLIFIEPPSTEELERRLRMRGTESEEAIRSRLETAVVELSAKERYNIRVVNDSISKATQEILDIIASYRQNESTK